MTKGQHQIADWPYARFPTAALRGAAAVQTPVSHASITAVLADGWTGFDTAPPVAFTPHTDPAFVYVQRGGFDANANTTTNFDQITLMDRKREVWPAQDTKTANDVVLANRIYAGDTPVGFVNNSTKAYPKPICMWLGDDNVRVTGQTYTARLAVAHWAGRNGTPLASARIFVTDGVDTYSVLTSTVVARGYDESGLYVCIYEAPLDFTGLAPDTLLDLDAELFPHRGDSSFLASVDFATWPSRSFCERKIFNAVSAAEATIIAHVDGVGAGTPTASIDAGTAAANPFATVLDAANAIVAIDGADASRGHIYIKAGVTVGHSSTAGIAVGPTPLIVEGENRASSVLTDNGAPGGTPNKIKFVNLTLQRDAVSNFVFIDSAATGPANENTASFVNVTFDVNGNASFWGAWIYRVGRCWFEGCDGIMPGIAEGFGGVSKVANFCGCNGNFGTASAMMNMVGSYASHIVASYSENGDRPAREGIFFGFNHVTSLVAGSAAIDVDEEIDAAGGAFVGMVVEKTIALPAPAFAVNAGGQTHVTQNVILDQLSVRGGRCNIGYNDTAPYPDTHLTVKNSIFDQMNVKTDVREEDGAAYKNWPTSYKIDHRNNAYLLGSSSEDTVGPGHWPGELLALGDQIGSDAEPIDADYTDDRSSFGTATGGGNYQPGAGHELNFVPAADLSYPYDLKGVAVPLDGTAIKGALQVT